MKPITIEAYNNDPDVSFRMQEYAKRERAKAIGELAARFACRLRANLAHLRARLRASPQPATTHCA